MKSSLIIIYLLIVSISSFPIDVKESGVDPVDIYSTAIKFRITLTNSDSNKSYNVTVSPESCCLHIDKNDTDCNIMILGHSKLIKLAPIDSVNNTGTVIFMYRNLYARYRVGYCIFLIVSTRVRIELKHKINFNTTPTDGTTNNCTYVDEDPDRDCMPVDCAIKYKGYRNFYRNKTGKCEPVVPCNTRGTDSITVTGYYDWEENVCVHYKWFEDENYFEQIESDITRPVDLDPSQTIYYSDLQPNLLTKENMSTKLQCNHGKLAGTYCKCDPGWVSSGIHKDDPLYFHWCDIPQRNPSAVAGGAHPPVELTGTQETAAIICLSIANLMLFMLCTFLLINIICPTVLNYWFKRQL